MLMELKPGAASQEISVDNSQKAKQNQISHPARQLISWALDLTLYSKGMLICAHCYSIYHG